MARSREKMAIEKSILLAKMDSLEDQTKFQSRTSQVYSSMRSDIITGILRPGHKLKIEELTKTYGVGSSPIREALSLLTSDTLVTRNDQRGFRVVEVSTEEFDELLKTRVLVEQLALKESMLNGDDIWEEKIILAAHRLSRLPRSASSDIFVANDEWDNLHKKFHMSLVSACGSSILIKFCDQLYDQNTRYRHLAAPRSYPMRDINVEHDAISTAVVSRNKESSLKLLADHYQRTGSRLRSDIVALLNS